MSYKYQLVTILLLLLLAANAMSNVSYSQKKNTKTTQSKPKTQKPQGFNNEIEMLEKFQREAAPLSAKMEERAQKCLDNDLAACEQLQKDTTAMMRLTCKYNIAPNSCAIADAREKQAQGCQKEAKSLYQCFEAPKEEAPPQKPKR